MAVADGRLFRCSIESRTFPPSRPSSDTPSRAAAVKGGRKAGALPAPCPGQPRARRHHLSRARTRRLRSHRIGAAKRTKLDRILANVLNDVSWRQKLNSSGAASATPTAAKSAIDSLFVARLRDESARARFCAPSSSIEFSRTFDRGLGAGSHAIDRWQDKSREVRRGRKVEERKRIRHFARGATAHDSLPICSSLCKFSVTCTSRGPRMKHNDYLGVPIGFIRNKGHGGIAGAGCRQLG
jgi:hypothetical protein